MSTHEEIMAVYEDDIASQSSLVESKFGKKAFYDGFRGFSICNLGENSGAEKIVCSEYRPRRKNAAKIR